MLLFFYQGMKVVFYRFYTVSTLICLQTVHTSKLKNFKGYQSIFTTVTIMGSGILCRNPDDYMRETKLDIFRAPKIDRTIYRPEAAAIEYIRALNATKLERVFAKPFIGNLEGHTDGVLSFSKHPQSLVTMASGSFDGVICIWDLPMRLCKRKFEAHEGFVRGITYTADGSRFLSVGDDKTVKTWNAWEQDDGTYNDTPLNVVMSRTVLTGISHHAHEPVYATCGEVCYLWEENRSVPLQTMKFQVDTLHDVKFNMINTEILAACGSDRSIILYDKRLGQPFKKVTMKMKPNKLSWNPKSAHIFTVANEDYNLYTFDGRKIKDPVKIHKGHVSAVMDVDWAPTGEEFVSGSFDKTVRIFEAHKSNSRDVYHTKRMQHVVVVGWSLDNKYVYSGSDEMNIRLWKARASEKLGALRPREKFAFDYNEALKERFAAHPQVKRIARHRHVPKHIYNEARNLREQLNKIKRKENNLRMNSAPGTVPYVADLKTKVIKTEVAPVQKRETFDKNQKKPFKKSENGEKVDVVKKNQLKKPMKRLKNEGKGEFTPTPTNKFRKARNPGFVDMKAEKTPQGISMNILKNKKIKKTEESTFKYSKKGKKNKPQEEN